MEVTLGGDRLGSGNKQKVELHNYQMSSFNLEQDWKSSMAPGVLYPFIKMVGTNHGTFDIDLDSFVRTLPTKGPLFGSFKLQVDLFSVPFRLYQAILHNNPQKIGMKMNQVYLPKFRLIYNTGEQARLEGSNEYNWQINESSLLKYLGLSGIGTFQGEIGQTIFHRKFNAIPVLAYYDIFKNYYANKQEENAYVITPGTILEENVTNIEEAVYLNENGQFGKLPVDVETTPYQQLINIVIYIKAEGTYEDAINEIKLNLGDENYNDEMTLYEWMTNTDVVQVDEIKPTPGNNNSNIQAIVNMANARTYLDGAEKINITLKYAQEREKYMSDIHLTPFALQNIDDMRNALLSKNNFGHEFIIGTGPANLQRDWSNTSGSDGTGYPYSTLIRQTNKNISWNAFNMNGLVVKTYQSDLFNNWLDTEWIDGEEGIAALTAINTTDGKFTIDSFVFAEKLYDIYNRIATGGGTYEDWQEAVYGEGAVRKAETPMYIGGMAAEIMFEEVISSAETNVKGDFQALGSLGGKGTQVGSRGGKNIHVKCDEPSYIMGIVSLTPRICYNQGNDWDLTELDTMDDLHKPGMDGIGFQDLIVENMAWWNTKIDEGMLLSRDSAGKQTAWIQYQTAIDKSFADFAKTDGYGFMVLNRNYEMDPETPGGVKDLTTYIDPRKYNYAFAYNELAAQNFWVQIHSKVVARRKMGAQQIPNL